MTDTISKDSGHTVGLRAVNTETGEVLDLMSRRERNRARCAERRQQERMRVSMLRRRWTGEVILTPAGRYFSR